MVPGEWLELGLGLRLGSGLDIRLRIRTRVEVRVRGLGLGVRVSEPYVVNLFREPCVVEKFVCEQILIVHSSLTYIINRDRLFFNPLTRVDSVR